MPDAREAEALEFVQLLRETVEVADAVVVSVVERLDVRFVDDRILVPERIIHAWLIAVSFSMPRQGSAYNRGHADTARAHARSRVWGTTGHRHVHQLG